jgi:hypothetical protein
LQPTDPYNPIPLAQQSREAAVELLIQRSELDSEIAAAMSKAVEPRLPVAAELLAAALRRRPPDGGRALTEIILAWRPNRAATLAFAAAADGTVAQIAAPEVAPYWVAAAGRRAYRMARTATALLVGPVMGAAVAWYTDTHHWGAAPASPSLADAVAALAVVATINVFTVQLSAQRLPGAIARVAGRPGWLVAAYSVAVTMAALSAFPGRQALLATALGWARVVLVAIFLVTLVGAMYVIVRRTDPGRAAGAFADATFAAYRAAGRRLGRIQAKAAVIRALLDDLVGFERGIEPELVGVRTRVFARRRGLLLPSSRRLRRLAAVSEVAGGNVRIRISPGIGTTVTRGEQIAAVLPASFATVPRRIPRRVGRVLRIRRMRRLDDVATSAVALVAMAVDLAGSGDVGSAETVAEVAAELVSEHVVAARTARRRQLRRHARRATRLERRHPAHVLRAGVGSAAAAERARDTEPAPIAPALRDTVKATVRAQLRGDRDIADVPEMILEALLRRSELAEWGATVAVTEIPQNWEQVGTHPSAVIQLLTMSGVRALELRDRQTIALVRDRLQRLSDQQFQRLSDQQAEWVVGGASVLTALTCWLAPGVAGEMFTWYEKLADGVKTELRLDLCRVGAAALVAGVPSVAVRAADGLLRTSPDLPLLRRFVLGDVVRGREEAHSTLQGGYLGASPADALADFLTMLERLQSVLSQP